MYLSQLITEVKALGYGNAGVDALLEKYDQYLTLGFEFEFYRPKTETDSSLDTGAFTKDVLASIQQFIRDAVKTLYGRARDINTEFVNNVVKPYKLEPNHVLDLVEGRYYPHSVNYTGDSDVMRDFFDKKNKQIQGVHEAYKKIQSDMTHTDHIHEFLSQNHESMSHYLELLNAINSASAAKKTVLTVADVSTVLQSVVNDYNKIALIMLNSRFEPSKAVSVEILRKARAKLQVPVSKRLILNTLSRGAGIVSAESLKKIHNVHKLVAYWESGGRKSRLQRKLGAGDISIGDYHSGGFENWRIETDVSLSTPDKEGAELISPPIKGLSQAITTLHKALKHIRDIGGTTDSTTGIHINISFNDPNQTTPSHETNEFKLLLLMKRLEPSIYKRFANRRGNFYSKDVHKFITDPKTQSATLHAILNLLGEEITSMSKKAKQEKLHKILTNDQHVKQAIAKLYNREVKIKPMPKTSDFHYFGTNVEHISNEPSSRVEFRYMGGEDYHKKVSEVTDTIRQYCVAMVGAHTGALHKTYIKEFMRLINELRAKMDLPPVDM